VEFQDRVAVVTGAASGIGRAAAAQLARGGARVVMADINRGAGAAAAEELAGQGGRAEFLALDVSQVEEIRAFFAQILARHGRIDVLVNAAGIGSLTAVPEITAGEWDRVMAVNLRSAFFCSQEALASMCPRRFGKIINLASAAAKMGGVAVGAHYAASKAAIVCLTKSLALYAAPHGVNVNCVCPGPTVTPLTDSWGEKLNRSFAEKIPFKRYGRPEEVAEAICFLASERAAYITGETMDVNGGLVMD
jgi:NAD(P)-dependent dehydrogenase (short-subunit alcohol dehydrogenase family)